MTRGERRREQKEKEMEKKIHKAIEIDDSLQKKKKSNVKGSFFFLSFVPKTLKKIFQTILTSSSYCPEALGLAYFEIFFSFLSFSLSL